MTGFFVSELLGAAGFLGEVGSVHSYPSLHVCRVPDRPHPEGLEGRWEITPPDQLLNPLRADAETFADLGGPHQADLVLHSGSR